MDRPAWPRAAVIVWAAVLLGIAAEAVAKPRGHTVFDIYAAAGRAWAAGADLYARQPATGELFRYAPAAAAGFAPLAALPPGVGNAAWKLLNAGVFLLGLGAWCRRTELRPVQVAGVFLAALPVALGSLHVGQANLLVTGFALLGLAAADRGRWAAAAGWVAAAALVKAFPVVLALLLAGVYPRRFGPRFVVALAVGLLVPFLLEPAAVAADHLRAWAGHLVESGELNRDRLRSLDKLLEVAGIPVGRGWFLFLGAMAGAGVFAACWWRSAHSSDRREVLALALGGYTAWVLLFSPATETVTYSIAAPVLAVGLVEALGRPGAWAARGVLIACVWLCGLATTDATPPPVRDWCRDHAAPAAGAVLLAGWLAADTARRARRDRRPAEAAPAPLPLRRAA